MLSHIAVVKGIDGCPKIIRDTGLVADWAEMKLFREQVKTRKLLIAVVFVSFSHTSR
jgi:hypothetical protein